MTYIAVLLYQFIISFYIFATFAKYVYKLSYVKHTRYMSSIYVLNVDDYCRSSNVFFVCYGKHKNKCSKLSSKYNEDIASF